MPLFCWPYLAWPHLGSPDKEKITQIYESGKIPIIYDCQNKLKVNVNWKSKLVYLGD